MLDSLINLPAAIPSLWRSLHAGKKRRTAASRNCFAQIEGLEARELLSAANANVERGGVPRIINGTTTTNFSAVGELTFTPTTGAVTQSTGTLITSEWVLTTASASKGLSLTGGTATVILGGVTYTVDQVVTYPKYYAGSIDFKQDIALWHLSTAVDASITPLNISTTTVAAKTTVTLVGFGGTGTGTTGSDGTYGTKQFATTKVERVSPSQLVWKLDSNTEGTSAPTGDIGGPVLKLTNGVYTVVGLASYHTTTTGKIGDSSYSTRVDLYAGWIDDTIGRAHPTTTVLDDYIDTADTVGTTNRKFTFSTTAYSADFGGKFHQYGDVDVFKVVTMANGYVTFDLKNYAPSSQLLDVKLEILGSDGTTVLNTSDDTSASNLNSYIGTYLASGTYFVRVSTYANSQKGSYRLTMKANFDNVGDTAATAKTLTPNSLGTVTSDVYMNTTTDVDWYKFKANKSGKFQFDFAHTNPGSFDPVIAVYAADQTTLLASNDDISLPTNLDARVTINTIVSGTYYYVKLTGYSGSTGLGKLTVKKVL